MSFDPITETIAHFIGAFNLSEEAARSRAEYDRFRAEQAAEKKAEDLDLHSVRLKAPHQLEGFDPGVSYKAPPVDGLKAAPAFTPTPFAASVEVQNAPVLPMDFIQNGIAALSTTVTNLVFNISPASSIINLTFQISTLSDNDTFGPVLSENFAPIADLEPLLETLADWAQGLSPIRLDLAPSADNWFIAVKTIMDAAPETAMAVQGPLSVAVFAGADATGYVLNGQAVAELPEFDDFLPLFHIEPDAADPEDTTGIDGTATNGVSGSDAILTAQTVIEEGVQAAHHFAKDFEQDPSQRPEQADGHQVVAGANTMVNQTTIFSNWLDAPVFVVVGDVLDFDAISQTNVIIDQDVGLTTLSGQNADGSVINAAGIITKDSLAEKKEDEDLIGDDEQDVEPIIIGEENAPTGAPTNWVMTTVTGDVTQINWVEQVSFITDYDRADVTVKASKTFIGLGENASTNSADFWEIGFQYDLIVIGGNLIDVNLINQLNVMIDSDVVKPKDAIADAKVDTSKTVETKVDGAPGAVADDAPAPSGISTSDNLLYNSAEIVTQGDDVTTALLGEYKELAEDFLNDEKEVGDNILDNDVFDGTELLRVLHIDGDFKTINAVNQTNVLGDSDQVHLSAGDFAAALNKEIQITTGSNIQANFAKITDAGQPTEIHAGGEVYSDALIHQAELVDTNASPTGVNIHDLTSEAVAFLVDGMIEPDMAGDIISSTNDAIASAMSSSDLMQQMLG